MIRISLGAVVCSRKPVIRPSRAGPGRKVGMMTAADMIEQRWRLAERPESAFQTRSGNESGDRIISANVTRPAFGSETLSMPKSPCHNSQKAFVLLVLSLALARGLASWAQNTGLSKYEMAGQAIASQFFWSVKAEVTAPNPGMGTIQFDTAWMTLRDGPPYEPWRAGVPVLIQDGANTEVVVLTASNCAIGGPGHCQASADFAHPHNGRLSVASGSGGLQEAIDFLGAHGGTVLLTPGWSAPGDAIAGASGSAGVQIEDTRGAAETWYGWNGSQYMPIASLQPGGNGLAAQAVNQVRNATAYPGPDIGAKVNAAIAAGAGMVVIPAGTYPFNTPIVLPRDVSLRGQGGTNLNGVGTAGTVLEYNGTGCAIIVGDTSGPSGQPALLGASASAGFVLKGNSGGSITPGRYGLCLGTDPQSDGSNWAALGELNAYSYRFRDIEITGFDHGIEWGSNAFNLGFSGLQIDSNNVGITEASGLSNSESNNWFTRTVWYGNTGGALLQPSGGAPQGAAISCVQCDFEWNNDLNESSTSAASAGPQITGGMVCVDCHFEGWGGVAWETTATMSNPRVVLLGGFYGADSTAITSDPAAFSFAGTGSGPQVTIFNLYLNTAHTIGEGVDCLPDGTNPTCDVEAVPLAGGNFTQLVSTASAGGTAFFPGSYLSLPTYGIWQSGSPLTIGVGAGSEALALEPSREAGPAAPSPSLDLYAWNGSTPVEYTQFVDSAGNWNLIKVGGGGSFNFNGPTTSGAFQSSSPDPAAVGAVRLANTDVIAWRNAANNGDVMLGPPVASGQAATAGQLPLAASLTTTAAPSDTLTIPGVTAASHCVATATNAAAAALADVYVAAVSADSVTLDHGATAGASFDIVCTPN